MRSVTRLPLVHEPFAPDMLLRRPKGGGSSGSKWNLQKIGVHGLPAADVEASFDRVLSLDERDDRSYRMFAVTPSGRQVWVIWRHDREDERAPMC